MGLSSSSFQPQELYEFRKLHGPVENIEIPARPHSRKVTDKKGFILFGITILVFIAFLTYTLLYSDIRRFFTPFDNCGDLCGFKNEKVDGIPCSGKDLTFKRYGENGLFVKKFNKTCVSACPRNVKEIFGFCLTSSNHGRNKRSYDDDFFRDNSDKKFNEMIDRLLNDVESPSDVVQKGWWKFILVLLITITLCFIALILLRYATAVVVWGILTLSILVLLGLLIAAWWYYATLPKQDFKSVMLFCAIILTIFNVVVVLLILCLFRRVPLVINLYKETTKAIFAIPTLLFIPVFIILLSLIVLGGFLTSTIWMVTAGEFKKIGENSYEYKRNFLMIFTMVFNLVITFWTLQFLAAIQYLIIAGSIASWYFLRNKNYLDTPLFTSLAITLKYHIGTAAFGSFILTIFFAIKLVIRMIIKQDKLRCLFECCCHYVEAFLQFLSKNSYIETAIHGQSFFRSGRRAAKLLVTNASSVIALNSVGDFVLGITQFILVVIGTGIGILMFGTTVNCWLAGLLCFIINLLIVIIVFAVFESTADTLLICFCEDKVINDGISKPYFMSKGLMEFVENSKKVYKPPS